MNVYWFAGAAAFAILTGSTLAQNVLFDATNSTQPTMSTTGPAGTYDMTKTRQTIDSTGAETDTTETFSKSQTYTNSNGALSARSSIRTTGPTTTTVPSPDLPPSTSKENTK
jgi:hypothetical protein